MVTLAASVHLKIDTEHEQFSARRKDHLCTKCDCKAGPTISCGAPFALAPAMNGIIQAAPGWQCRFNREKNVFSQTSTLIDDGNGHGETHGGRHVLNNLSA